MGKGTDMARAAGAKEHADLMDAFKEDLLIAFVVKNGGTLEIPVADVDAMGGYTLAVRVDPERQVFEFTAQRKQ